MEANAVGPKRILKSTDVNIRLTGIVPKRPISGGFNLTLGMMLPGLS